MSEHSKKKLSVLMELRPAIDGYAGIPQETRLLFALFRGMPEIDTSGLILHGARQLPRGIAHAQIDAAHPHRDLVQLSRAVIALAHRPSLPFIARLRRTIRIYLSRRKLAVDARHHRSIRLSHFLGEPFRDFVWEHFFAKTLSPNLFEQVTGGHFALLSQSYRDLQLGRSGALFPLIDTRDYDVFLAQTPWPSRLSPTTRLVVRYHDAIPLLLPHTIQSAPYHQGAHYTALVSNQRDGIFVCNSEHTRRGLLRFFPRLENRSPVIHDVVSENYFPDTASDEHVRDIIASRQVIPEAAGGTAGRPPPIGDQPLRYLVLVSTIEPRKNHARAIAGWIAARARGADDLKLIIVGSIGWSADSAVAAMRDWQDRGALFHLSGVPTDELRVLYSGAVATLCPSIDEGFDLSGIEAMQCGSPVLASDIAVHREVFGDACLYFDPYAPAELGVAIRRIAASDAATLPNNLRERGIKQADRYRPSALLPQWAQFYESLRGGRFGAAPGEAFDPGKGPVRSGWRASAVPPDEPARLR